MISAVHPTWRRQCLFIALAIVTITAAIIRFHDVKSNPLGFFCDEADVGLNAWYLAHKGTDATGRSYPLVFNLLGDGKGPVLIYSAVLPTLVFGIDEVAVRYTAAAYGFMTCILLFLLARKMFGLQAAFWAMTFIALCPWHAHLSRVAFDCVPAAFWTTVAIYFSWGFRGELQKIVLILVSFYLAFMSYSAAKIVLPFVFIALAIIGQTQIKKSILSKKQWATAALILLLLVLVTLPSYFDGSLLARWRQVATAPRTMSQYFNAYLNHFSIDFLFTKGDSGFPEQFLVRHSVPGMGELYWIQLVLVVAGLIFGFRSDRLRIPVAFCCILLVVFPLGSIFVDNIPFATRSFLGTIPFSLLSGLGAERVIALFPSKLKSIAFAILALVTLISFQQYLNLMREYPKVAAGGTGWQAGFKESIQYYVEHGKEFREMRISHRFNGPEVLNEFFSRQLGCTTCKVLNNPIIIDPSLKQLFALYPEDLEEARVRYPGYRFLQVSEFRVPSATELAIGSFVSR